MKERNLYVEDSDLDFDSALEMARDLAAKENEETMLIAWFDRQRNKHSPAAVFCEINGRPGWEVYGENHQGRIKIIINNRQYVFIFS